MASRIHREVYVRFWEGFGQTYGSNAARRLIPTLRSKEVEEGGMWFEPSNRVVVITYAKFGLLYEKNFDFYKHFSYIICDEIYC